MSNPTPETIGNELQQRIWLLLDANEFLSPEDPRVVRISDDLDKLGRVDAQRRSLLLVSLSTVCGDREKAEYYLKNCRSIHVNSIDIALAQLTMLMNLGYYSETLPVVRSLAEPTSGVIKQLLEQPPGNGAYHLLTSILRLAEKMGIQDIPDASSALPKAARIMDQWGDTDEDYSNALDVAGTIMRERKLIHHHNMIMKPVESTPDGGLGYVKMAYIVGVDLDTAIEMTQEFTTRLAASHMKIPPSMIFEFEAVE